MRPSSGVRIARIYNPPGPEDGARILVDRLWPRGVRKDAAHLDDWCRAVAPSAELRRWYGHAPPSFGEFEQRYRAELEEPERAAALDELRARAARERVTLLTAVKQVEISHVAVLAAILGGPAAG